MRGLLGYGTLEDEVADASERENGGGEGIASGAGATTEKVREELVVVFWIPTQVSNGSLLWEDLVGLGLHQTHGPCRATML